jgi:hypothetical protein
VQSPLVEAEQLEQGLLRVGVTRQGVEHRKPTVRSLVRQERRDKGGEGTAISPVTPCLPVYFFVFPYFFASHPLLFREPPGRLTGFRSLTIMVSERSPAADLPILPP